MGWVVLIVVVVLSLVFAVVIAKNPKLPPIGNSTEYDAETVSTENPRPTDTELLSDLPFIFYLLAILCGVVLIGFTIANAAELNSTQMGAWIGYTIGSVLSMLAVGRVIELLQQIRDAVRS